MVALETNLELGAHLRKMLLERSLEFRLPFSAAGVCKSLGRLGFLGIGQ